MSTIENSTQLINSVNANALFTISNDYKLVAKTGFSKLLQKISDIFTSRTELDARKSQVDHAMKNLLSENLPLPNLSSQKVATASTKVSGDVRKLLETIQGKLSDSEKIGSSQNISKKVQEKIEDQGLVDYFNGWKKSSQIPEKNMQKLTDFIKNDMTTYMGKGYLEHVENGFHEQFIKDMTRGVYNINGKEYPYLTVDGLLDDFQTLIPNESSRVFVSSLMSQTCFSQLVLGMQSEKFNVKLLPAGFPRLPENFMVGSGDGSPDNKDYAIKCDLQYSKDDPENAKVTVTKKFNIDWMDMNHENFDPYDKNVGSVNFKITYDCKLGEEPSIKNCNVEFWYD
ncbi:MAG: hypothetical protein K5657_05830 [Desulfovibrio sp.]|nr:hypothetical protein [Desulfovibrio sp.]